MRNNKLYTPDGVRDYLPKDLAFKTEIERRIESVFHRYGYLSISSPMFEHMEVFEEIGSAASKQMYKFLDRDGSILALRSDMTPAIARIASTCYNEEDIPLRFCYFENSFRYNENYQGKLKEFTQAGIELIGVNSDAASAEVIAVAVNSLLAAGLSDFRIDIGQVQFLNGLLEESGLDTYACEQMQRHVLEREYTAAEKFIIRQNMNNNVKKLLKDLPFLIGGKEVLSRALSLTKNAKAINALDNLKNIYEMLCEYGMEKFITFDLGMMGHLDYYTGLIFRGYASGTGSSVINGGRYDGLLKKFGTDYPAVGFAIKCNGLIDAITVKKAIEIRVEADTLISYTTKGRAVAISVADELRSSGLAIENSLIADNIEKNIMYAKKKGMGGMLYFIDDSHIKIFDFVNEVEKDVDIGELLQDFGINEMRKTK